MNHVADELVPRAAWLRRTVVRGNETASHCSRRTLDRTRDRCVRDIGTLEIPSLAELRTRVSGVAAGRGGPMRVSTVVADVGELHRDAKNRHALFQVASQFNLLEMTGPEITPEDGVTRYAHDRTQGPACAIAAGATTVYRNYCVPIGDGTGQTRDRQIDCLRDLGAALSIGAVDDEKRLRVVQPRRVGVSQCAAARVRRSGG